MSGRYRPRTWLRTHLPYVLSDRIGKARRDRGAYGSTEGRPASNVPSTGSLTPCSPSSAVSR